MLNLAHDALRAEWSMGGLTPHRRPFLIKDRTLDTALVVQFLQGEARVEVEGETFTSRPGDAWFIKPGATHTVELIGDAVLSRWAHLRCTLFGSLDVFRLIEPPRVFTGKTAARIGDLNQQLTESSRADQDDVRRAVRVNALTYDLVDLLLQNGKPVSGGTALAARVARLAPVLDHIDRNLHRPLTREELAKLLGVSSPRFYAVFSEAIGVSLREYLQRRRLERARQQLIATRDSVEDIGKRVGISNPCHFSRWFRSRTRLTPTDYRRRVGDEGI